jgi:hypothetical protein
MVTVDPFWQCNQSYLQAMSESNTVVRPGAATYIDEAVTEPLESLQITTNDTQDSFSGSSVEEEVDSEDVEPEPLPASGGDAEPRQRLEDFAYLDQRRHASESDDISDESDWDVDDEDWELANGGKLLLSHVFAD